MKITNYHTHSKFCDGTGELREYIAKAIENEMFALGFSGHAPVPFHSEWNMTYANFEKYLSEIDLLKKEFSGRLKIFKGAEIDFISNISNVNNFINNNLDYTIGGIHYLEKFDNGEYWNFDSSAAIFEKGCTEIFKGNVKKAVETYYNRMCEMIENYPPTIVAHFDIIAKFNRGNRFFDQNADWYKMLYNRTLDAVKKNNCVLEINTRGVFRQLSDEFYPETQILTACRTKKIPVTVNADAHSPKEVNSLFNKVYKHLLNIGFEKIWFFDENGWQEQKIELR